MKLSFDIRGYFKPYEKIDLSYELFQDVFVASFDEKSNRHKLFDNYRRYLEAFQSEVTEDFTHWINGSFVTNQINPKDIDFVVLLDFEIALEHNKLIKDRFVNANVYNQFGIDAYLVQVYPENHKLFIQTKSDLLYWNDWFTKSKMNRVKKRFPKGYIAINFEL